MPRYARLDANRRIIDLYDADSASVLEQRMGVSGWIEVAGNTAIHSHVALDGTVTPPNVVVSIQPRTVDRYGFRMLFTTAERKGLDSAVQGALTDDEWKTFKTMMEDLRSATTINLGAAIVISGVNFLEAKGFIANGRAAQILAG